MCEKAVDYYYPRVLEYVCDCYVAPEMCEKAISKKPFALKHCLDKYKTQDICGKVVDACLTALKFVPDWYVANKILNVLDNAAFFK